MELVENYIASLDEPKKEWVALMVNFMREVFPDVKETLSNKSPTYKGDDYYIAFAAQKNYFTFHTDDMMGLSLINALIPSAFMGKSCAKIKYNNESTKEEHVVYFETYASITARPFFEKLGYTVQTENSVTIDYAREYST